MARNILVVEDDNNISNLIKMYLDKEGFDVRIAADGGKAVEEYDAKAPDMVLLDIMLPEEDGLQILKKLRAAPETRRLPVILLTAKNSEFDRVIGLDNGADDFISKPFSMLELIARIRAVLRRSQPAQSVREYRLGPLYVSPEQHIVRVDGQDVALTNKEFELLCLLLDNQGLVLTRQVLMDRVWGFEAERENRTLDVHIRTLRVKLGAAGSLIETIRGVGYKLGSGT